jgi:hypothetical protein
VDGELPPTLENLRVRIYKNTLRFEIAKDTDLLRLPTTELDGDS